MTIPRTAVVLSGGAGVRLRPITQEIPKGLIKIGGKPILQWVVEWLKKNGVSEEILHFPLQPSSNADVDRLPELP